MHDEELEKAVSTAIDQATPEDVLEAQETDDVPDDTDDAGEGAPAGGDVDGAGGGAARAGATEAPAEGDGEIDPQTGKPKGGKADAQDQAAAPGTAEAKGAKARKGADHVNDPIPEDLAEKTRERMTNLVTTVKSVTAERDSALEKLENIVAVFDSTGASQEMIGATMQMLEDMHSSDPQHRREALSWLRKQVETLADELGEEVPGRDPLDAHEDLREDVEDGVLSRARALEIAKARARDRADTRHNETRTAEQEQATAIERGRSELNALGAELMKADPQGYATKTKILLPLAQRMARTLPPDQWAAAYREAYARLAVSAAPSPRVGGAGGPQRAPDGTGERQPRRGRSGPQGGMREEPKSMLDAVNAGIEHATRR